MKSVPSSFDANAFFTSFLEETTPQKQSALRNAIKQWNIRFELDESSVTPDFWCEPNTGLINVPRLCLFRIKGHAYAYLCKGLPPARHGDNPKRDEKARTQYPLNQGYPSMAPDDSDRRLRARIEEAFIPEDLCKTDPGAIEALLDAAKAEAFSEDKVGRMMKKLQGDIPLGDRETEEEDDPIWTESELTAEEEALVALHRNGGTQLPPEVQEKLRRLREQAKGEPAEGETCDD